MRQRKIKDLEHKLEKLAQFIVAQPTEAKGRWNEVFGNKNPIFVEIGCGKGQFINAHADLYPERNYIGIEGQRSVLLRAIEKTAARARGGEEASLVSPTPECAGNILYIGEFVGDLTEIFTERELSGIYLNFSDPWPKDRHAKRRLTHIDRLKSYFKVLKDGAFVEFKTDNDALFEFSLTQIEEGGYFIEEITRDLKNSAYSPQNITTEYENKFMLAGKNINYVKIRA